VLNPGASIIRDSLIIIDEASNIDFELKTWILKRTLNCKILYVGDSAQTIHHKAKFAIVFYKGYPESILREQVRQSGNSNHPIKQFAMTLAKTVMTGQWTKFKFDNYHIRLVSRDEFDSLMLKDFTSLDWNSSKSRYMAWQNKTVIEYNKLIASHKLGTSEFRIGDYAVVNSSIRTNTASLKTDQQVYITDKKLDMFENIRGTTFTLNNSHVAFMPSDIKEMKKLALDAATNNRVDFANYVYSSILDLRHMYASTINKAMGSTFEETAYLDLDNISKCNNPNQIARMMYVGASRPKKFLVMTGELK